MAENRALQAILALAPPIGRGNIRGTRDSVAVHGAPSGIFHSLGKLKGVASICA